MTFSVVASNWEQLFGAMEIAKVKFELEDYSVSQTTLEQIFLDFTRTQVAEEGA